MHAVNVAKAAALRAEKVRIDAELKLMEDAIVAFQKEIAKERARLLRGQFKKRKRQRSSSSSSSSASAKQVALALEDKPREGVEGDNGDAREEGVENDNGEGGIAG